MASYSEILTNLSNALPSLTSNSAVAIFKKVAEVISGFVDFIILEFGNTKTIINNIIVNQRYGFIDYYINVALCYQVGITPSKDNNGKFYYTLSDGSKFIIGSPVKLYDENGILTWSYFDFIDNTKILVSQSAVQIVSNQNGDVLTMKVAKLENDLLVKLETGEKQAFDNFVVTYQIPGIPITKVSNDSNIFDFNLQISYKSSSDLTTLKTNVEAYLLEFRNTYLFNSVLYVNDLEVYLKSNIVGIRNAFISNTKLDNVSFTNSKDMSAGYFNYVNDILTKISYVAIS